MLSDYSRLRASATAVLTANDNGEYTRPSRTQHPYQGNWESALTALGWAELDPDRAYQELETLLGARDEQGMVTHIAFDGGAHGYHPGPGQWGNRISVDGRRITGITQMPVAAICLRLLHERYLQPERTRALLAPLHAWHTFLLTERNHDGTNEPVVIHPWETGRVSAAEWDAPLQAVPLTVESSGSQAEDVAATASESSAEVENGFAPEAAPEITPMITSAPHSSPEQYRALVSLVDQGKGEHWNQFQLAVLGAFRVLDPGFSAVLAAACQDLAALAVELGEETMGAESELLAFNIAEALNARAGVDGLTRALDVVSGQSLAALGAGTALTVLSPSLTREQVARLRGLLLDGELASPHGVRSLTETDPGFDASRCGRGSVETVVTWLCALGLERHGESAAAHLLRGRMLDAVQASILYAAQANGLYESVHPQSGQGLGASEFSPTAALTLWELGG